VPFGAEKVEFKEVFILGPVLTASSQEEKTFLYL
jgi:hypothetical protein